MKPGVLPRTILALIGVLMTWLFLKSIGDGGWFLPVKFVIWLGVIWYLGRLSNELDTNSR